MRSIHGVAQNQALKVERLEYAERKFQEIINDDSKSEEIKDKELERLMEYMEDHFSVKRVVENTHTDNEMEIPKRVLGLCSKILSARKR